MMKPSVFLMAVSAVFTASAEPLLDSWYLEGSRQYARMYGYTGDLESGTSYTSWRHPTAGTGQDEPAYAGVHEVSYDVDSVYVRSSGLGSHVMGPWFRDRSVSVDDDAIFVNWPGARGLNFRFPRLVDPANPPVRPAGPVETGNGAIGLMVDGVAMFDSRDAFSWSPTAINPATGLPGDDVAGTGWWERDAYVNEGQTFDNAFAHQATEAYHYHANPPALRYQLGDSIDYDAVTNTYTEAPNGQHSPIIGWVEDGLPVYGPYGYADPLDPDSDVVRMRSGYQPRAALVDGAARDSLPAWEVRWEGATLPAGQEGPSVSADYPRGRYMQDYEYLGDVVDPTTGLNYVLGADFDLDEYNTRLCVTPEFPNGVRAYFVSIEADGTPLYPYNIGRRFYARPRGAGQVVLPTTRTIHAEGGPESGIRDMQIAADHSSGDVVLSWVGVEGGRYEVTQGDVIAPTTEMQDATITTLTDGVPMGQITHSAAITGEQRKFYRVALESVGHFDDNGYALDTLTESSTADLVTFTLATDGPADLTVLPTTVLLDGEAVEVVGRPSANEVTIRYSESALSDTASLSVLFPSQAVAILGSYTAPSSTHDNILLIILDDWGVDASPVDNVSGAFGGLAGVGGANLPTMPNFVSLASESYQFTNGYVSPACSTTRMAIMSGRLASSTGVGSPGATAVNRDAASITTIAEVIDQQGCLLYTSDAADD